MTKKIFINRCRIVAATVLFMTGGVLAQSNNSATPEPEIFDETLENTDRSSEIKTVPQTASPDISNAEPNSQVFIPSEEISEDAPVAFPVDI